MLVEGEAGKTDCNWHAAVMGDLSNSGLKGTTVALGIRILYSYSDPRGCDSRYWTAIRRLFRISLRVFYVLETQGSCCSIPT